MGHMGKDCRSKNIKKGNNNGGCNDRNGGPKKKFMGTCNGCGKHGHKVTDCFKTKGKPNYKKGELANTAREKEEIAFMCMPCNEDDNSHKSHSFEPVDKTIDDEGYPVPDSFFDSFGGSDKEDDETAHCSVPDWYPSHEENVRTQEWCGNQEDPKQELEWIEVKPKKVDRRKTKKTLSKSTNEPKGSKTHKVTRGNARDKKLTRVHDCKRGKPTPFKPRAKTQAKHQVSKAHSAAENVNFNLRSSLVYHHVDRDAKPLYSNRVLQANGSIHGGKDPL